MKLKTTPLAGVQDPVVQRELREHATQVNQMAEGRIAAFYQAQAAPPASGVWAPGDFVKNSAPTELGAPGAKYVIEGWTYLVGGTWAQKRFLTGN